MPKRKDRVRTDKLFANLEQTALVARSSSDVEESSNLATIAAQPIHFIADSSKIPRLKKFRFQLLHHWLVHTIESCSTADIGGGKGLLSYLLNQSSWSSTVIDPHPQPLPDKYKSIITGLRVKIDSVEKVAYFPVEFQPSLACQFDLLIGLHAHGCNVKIIDAAAQYGCGFVLFPCCVIDEPLFPPPGVHWLESLAGYAVNQGLDIHPFRLNFKGQNIGLFYPGKRLVPIPTKQQ